MVKKEKIIKWEGIDGKAHPNGGGFVALTAKVEKTVYVGKSAKIFGNARVFGNVWVSGNARVYGDAWVSGKTKITQTVCIDAVIDSDKKLEKFLEWRKKLVGILR